MDTQQRRMALAHECLAHPHFHKLHGRQQAAIRTVVESNRPIKARALDRLIHARNALSAFGDSCDSSGQ
jgi:hypothetical protein